MPDQDRIDISIDIGHSEIATDSPKLVSRGRLRAFTEAQEPQQFDSQAYHKQQQRQHQQQPQQRNRQQQLSLHSDDDVIDSRAADGGSAGRTERTAQHTSDHLDSITRQLERNVLKADAFTAAVTSTTAAAATPAIHPSDSLSSHLYGDSSDSTFPSHADDDELGFASHAASPLPFVKGSAILSRARDSDSSSSNNSNNGSHSQSAFTSQSQYTLNDISEYSRAARQQQQRQQQQQQQQQRQTLNQKLLPLTHTIINPFNSDETQLFLMELAAALFAVALPMNIIELYVVLAALRLDEHVHLFSVTNCMFVSFNNNSQCHLVLPAAAVGYSLSKMVEICAFTERLLRGEVPLREGLYEITLIVHRPTLWPRVAIVPALAALSALSALYWSGTHVEMMTAMASGTVIGLMEYSSSSSNVMLSRAHDLMAGFLSAAVCVIVNNTITRCYVIPATFAGILWCLPGLRATLAINDISTGNPVTGTAKLVSAIITCVQLGIGVTAGLSLNRLFGAAAATLLYSQPHFTQPFWLSVVATFFNAMLIMILMDAKPSHATQLCFSSLLAYVLLSVLTDAVGEYFATWGSCVVIGVLGNIYGKMTSNPSVELWLFAILIIVPGAIGVSSVLANDTLTTINLFLHMLAVSVAIITGLFTANFIVQPIRLM